MANADKIFYTETHVYQQQCLTWSSETDSINLFDLSSRQLEVYSLCRHVVLMYAVQSK